MHTASRVICALAATTLLAGCGPSIFSLRVPLNDTASLVTSGGTVNIDDQRADEEREVHTGKHLFRCERWYGDETYQPAKVEYLRQLLQARVPTGSTINVRLDRLDTIEYCENTANRAAAAGAAGAAAGAGGVGIYIAPQEIPGGDSVLIRAAGEANGKPFDVSRGFDYSALTVPFPQMPAYNKEYVVRFKRAFNEIADQIVGAASASDGT